VHVSHGGERVGYLCFLVHFPGWLHVAVLPSAPLHRQPEMATYEQIVAARKKCTTPKCDNFGAPERNGLCSKHYVRPITVSAKLAAPVPSKSKHSFTINVSGQCMDGRPLTPPIASNSSSVPAKPQPAVSGPVRLPKTMGPAAAPVYYTPHYDAGAVPARPAVLTSKVWPPPKPVREHEIPSNVSDVAPTTFLLMCARVGGLCDDAHSADG